MVSFTSKFAARLLIVAIAAVLISRCIAACTPAKGKLVTLEHKVGGNLSIGKACGLRVSRFTYDGAAPDAYWWAGPSCNYLDMVKNGYRISNTRVAKAYKGGAAKFKLNPGVNLKNVGCISLWCESFRSDMGHIVVRKTG